MANRNSHTQQIRLFRNERLEKLTMVSPRGFCITWSIVLPLVAWAGWGTAMPLAAIALFSAGIIGWFLFEYVLHRSVFHWNPRSNAFKQFVFVMHGNHHVNPNDRLRNLMPLVVSLPISGIIWMTCVTVLGESGSWAFLGFILAYVAYDLTHYACHHWPMKGRIAAMLKRHHMRHHHLDQVGNYAITAIFLDRLFGTRIAADKPHG